MAKRSIWKGSYYIRHKTTDKWGNKYNTPTTYRQRATGVVVDKYGNFKGYEKPQHHVYGQDVKKARKPATFVRPNSIAAIKPRKAHVRNLS